MPDLKAMYRAIVSDPFPETMTIILGDEKLVYEKASWQIEGKTLGLRYGENPDQPAALYRLKEGQLTIGGISWRSPENALVSALTDSQVLQSGKHPGKTNLTDVDNGANILQYLAAKPAAVILKHNNPCGAAWSDAGIGEALTQAFWCDRIAAFGGVIVQNSPLTREAAELIAANYFEVVACPAYEEGTLEIIKTRKNLRILELPGLARLAELAQGAWLDIKSLSDGGIIVQKSFQNRIRQAADFMPATAKGPDGREISARPPTPSELSDLLFAWAVEAGVASNSVVFARNGVTLAIGAGEQDRVGSVDLAIYKARMKYIDRCAFQELGMSAYDLMNKPIPDPKIWDKWTMIEAEALGGPGPLDGSVMVSDGFFPFRDGVDVAINAGVAAIAHPGGSLRDYESIEACNEANPRVAMVFTGQRSFRH